MENNYFKQNEKHVFIYSLMQLVFECLVCARICEYSKKRTSPYGVYHLE